MTPRAASALALALGVLQASPGAAAEAASPARDSVALAEPPARPPLPAKPATPREARGFPWAWVALGGAAAAVLGFLVVGQAAGSNTVTVRGRTP